MVRKSLSFLNQKINYHVHTSPSLGLVIRWINTVILTLYLFQNLLKYFVSSLQLTTSVLQHNTLFNHLTPNNPYMGRTTPLTSKRFILHIYSTNIDTEYFKHALYSPFFFSSKCSLFHNANLFGSCVIHIVYTGCAKIKKIIPAPKG